MRYPVLAIAAVATLVGAAGCSGDDSGGSGAPSPRRSSASAHESSPASGKDSPAPAEGSVAVEKTVATGLDSPWGLAALPDGDLLVGSRDTGKVFRVDPESGRKTEAGTVPGVAAQGEGGLLGLAIGPDDGQVYAYFTSDSDNRIVKMVYEPEKPAGEQLGAPDTILRNIPKGFIHNGGRIAFGPDKMLYAGTGESGNRGLAQDKKSLGGKILRMTPDGGPAKGNPYPGSVVWSPGHRNVQGLTWDRAGRLWASEFGQDTWDELNLIKKGGNYGWPEAEGKGGTGRGFVDPLEQWRTSEASPSGVAYAKGSVWMAGLRGERLWRIPLDGTKAAADPQDFLEGKYGRLRTVLATDDGKLYLTTSNTDGRGDVHKGDDRILLLKVS